MKILQVISRFGPKHGGDAIVVSNVSVYMAKRGHEVTIITTDYDSDEKYNENIRKEGVEVIAFRCICHCLFFFPSPDMKRWLSKNIKNYDVVHLNCARSYQNNIIYKYAKKYSIPYILQAHGSVLPIFQKQRLKNTYDLFFGYRILSDASKVIAVSKAEVEQYKQAGIHEDKIVTVPNGIDIEAFKDLPAYGKFREKYDITENHMVLFIGRIHKRKGIDFLIKSFSELTREMSDVVLVIIGPDDGYTVEVEKLIRALNLDNRIRLLGYIDEKDKLSAYIDADVLVYPAIFEIFGLVPFEAIMCGTPVIVADDCGCGELVEESGAGYLVKYRDIEGLKEKMKLIIENPEEGKEKAERGKKYIEEKLMWDKVVRRVEEVYGGILS